MKKWIKAHSKILILILGIGFIAFSIYGFTIATESWHFVLHAIGFSLWVTILLWITGVIDKMYKWWEKD